MEALKSAVRDFQLQGLASEHDAIIMGELAHILCGGEVSPVQQVMEERILELERQAFALLCGNEEDAGLSGFHSHEGEAFEELRGPRYPWFGSGGYHDP